MWARLLVRASTRASGQVVETLLRAAQRHRAGLTIVNMADDEETSVDNAKGYTAAPCRGGVRKPRGCRRVTAARRESARARRQVLRYASRMARYGGHTTTCDLILDADIDIFDAIDADRADRVAEILDRDPDAIDRPSRRTRPAPHVTISGGRCLTACASMG